MLVGHDSTRVDSALTTVMTFVKKGVIGKWVEVAGCGVNGCGGNDWLTGPGRIEARMGLG